MSDSNIKWSVEQKLVKKLAKVKKTKEADKTLIAVKRYNKSQTGVYALGLKDAKDNYIIINIENIQLMHQTKDGTIRLGIRGELEGQLSALNNSAVSWNRCSFFNR